MVGVIVLEMASGIRTPDDHSYLWAFGGSNHPDRADEQIRRPHLCPTSGPRGALCQRMTQGVYQHFEIITIYLERFLTNSLVLWVRSQTALAN